MKKIPTIFKRNMRIQPALVYDEWHPDCLWVLRGEGIATRKYDGTCCLVLDGNLYKRREMRQDEVPPEGFRLADHDQATGKVFGWVPVSPTDPEDQWHREAFAHPKDDGTYELVGPRINGNKDNFAKHTLVPHGDAPRTDAPRDFMGLRDYFEIGQGQRIEGLVWHHSDGRMAKIKRRDFGLRW